MSRFAVAVVGALALASYVFIYTTGRAGLPIRSDGFSYYVYLPAWFIHHDPSLVATARDCCGGHFPEYTAMFRWPGTRRWVNPHPIGVAIMQAPLFLVAHGLTYWTNLSPDGFSLYYQHAAGLSGLLWGVAGLWVLQRLLRRHFSDGVTATALITITFGTNFFHYLTYDSGYSHAYSFFLFAAFLALTETWHRSPTARASVLVGAAAGMILLVRHTNALFLLVFLLYGVTSARTLRQTVARLLDQRRRVVQVGGTALLVAAPQLLLYWSATGSPFISAYGEMSFNFESPRVWGVLFSVQKGLFFWSPLLLLALAGWARLVASGHPARAFAVPSAVFLLVNTYLIASWWDWQFGGSYGHRGFVDAFPVFAYGFASVFAWSTRHRLRLAATIALSSAAIALASFQMLQYWNGIIPIADTTWNDYRAVFLRWH
jgi:hypothetical protein